MFLESFPRPILLPRQHIPPGFGWSSKYNQSFFFQICNITFGGFFRDLPLCCQVGSFTVLTTVELLHKPRLSFIYRDINQLLPCFRMREDCDPQRWPHFLPFRYWVTSPATTVCNSPVSASPLFHQSKLSEYSGNHPVPDPAETCLEIINGHSKR